MDAVERYDRQIRLWGLHGQDKCSSSKICLINADSLGQEILRGLCLAGIGSFIILDSQKLTAENIGSSFVPQQSIGKSRGEIVKSILLDINEDINCENYPVEKFLPNVSDHSQTSETSTNLDVKFWKQFSCVIASGTFYTNQLDRLSKICWTNNIPLIHCISIGFYGCFKNQLKEHIVSDTHPDWRPANADTSKPDTATISTRPIYEEFENVSYDIDSEEHDDEFITAYICLGALNLFFSLYGRMPGYNDDQVETDVSKLKGCVKKIVGKLYTELKTVDQCLYEISRYGGAELHVTSAFTGGCVAQEVIKIVTNQYVPVDDTLIYSSAMASVRTFQFNNIFKRQ